jgi:hypothetical protein
MLARPGAAWAVRNLNTVLDHFNYLKTRLAELEKESPRRDDADRELEKKLIRKQLRKTRKFLQSELREKKRLLHNIEGNETDER